MNNEVAPTSMLVPETKVFGRTPLPSFLGTGAKDNGEARLQPKQRTAGIKCSRESSERTAGQSEWDKTFEQARLD